MDFVHLRAHTDYSIVDGLLRVDSLFPEVKKREMTALAVTDVMNFYAVIKLYQLAQKEKVKLIVGADIWLYDPLLINENSGQSNAHGGNLASGSAGYVMTLICENNEGYQALTELISRAYLESPTRVQEIPLVNMHWLNKHTCRGLLALSGALEGDVGCLIAQGHVEKAKERIANWQSVFGENNYYLELQRLGFEGEQYYLNQAVKLAFAENLPVVATQNIRFLDPIDFDAHEVRYCVREGLVLEDPKRIKKYRPTQYLTTPIEMKNLFSDLPEALENTVEIAKRCFVSFNLGRVCLPDFSVPSGQTLESYLTQQAESGLKKRLEDLDLDLDLDLSRNDAGNKIYKKYHERLIWELEMIIKMGFSGYFMIVADFIQWAKNQGIPVGPGRGSGAGSLVAYALGITDLDPLPYDLLFERFLNPERVSMPDFDVDFCMEGRDRVIDYVMQKYGVLAVSQIITFGSMAAKAVVRDVGRVMGHAYGFVDSIAKLIPNELGMTLQQAVDQEEKLKERYQLEEEVKMLIDMGLKLEGVVRNVGKHAGGVVISPSKLTDFCPVYCEQGSKALVSQFDKDDVEAIGLVKFDFLGLRNLTIIDAAVKNINLNINLNKKLKIETIPLDDKKTFELLKKCQTTAVFQLESRGMKDLIRRLQPDSFEDIIALVALFRPGPLQSGMVDDFINRKHGLASISYLHGLTEPVLKSTYGVILYQEQVMLISQVLAGYTLGGADILRRAMGKKKPEEMAKQREIFIEGALKTHGISQEISSSIFDLMEKFAGYGFNKSHSAAYALVSYQTAYLKAHYPAEFMAAVLSSDMDNTDKTVVFIEDSKAIGLEILSPDINQSYYRFTVNNQKIIFGLGAVKGVGEAAANHIVQERAQKGRFIDLFDFCERVDLHRVNKRALEALIYSGAMDELGPSREVIFANLEPAMRWAQQKNHENQAGQIDLFSTRKDFNLLKPALNLSVESTAVENKYFRERDVLGLFLTGHPMQKISQEFKNILEVQPLGTLKPMGTGRKEVLQKIAGIVTDIRKIKTKKGNLLIILVLEDESAKQEISLFSDVFEAFEKDIKIDACLILEVQVTQNEMTQQRRVMAKNILSLEGFRQRYAKKIEQQWDVEEFNKNNNKKLLLVLSSDFPMEKLVLLQKVLDAHKGGEIPVQIAYHKAMGVKPMLFERSGADAIHTTPSCLSALENILGEGKLQWAECSTIPEPLKLID